ncbi:MAG TPA: DUF6491 family protein [Allosphingosinicella sp.]
MTIVLCGCAATPPDSREADALSRELGERVAGEPRSCIAGTQSQGLTVSDRQTIVSRQGDTIWVNRLESDCPGLRPFSTLIVEANGSQYCRGDRVRAVEAGSSIPGPWCVLRDFTPYRRR